MMAGHHIKFTKGWQDLELALMCDMLGALPDEILRQDARTIKRTYAILLEVHRVRNGRGNRGGKK